MMFMKKKENAVLFTSPIILLLWVVSWVTEQFKTKDIIKLGNIWKASKLGGDTAYCSVSFP